MLVDCLSFVCSLLVAVECWLLFVGCALFVRCLLVDVKWVPYLVVVSLKFLGCSCVICLLFVWCVLCVVRCLLSVVCCSLLAVRCSLCVVCCVLCVGWCLLVCCLLFALCWLLVDA